jgi:hypothetical protein
MEQINKNVLLGSFKGASEKGFIIVPSINAREKITQVSMGYDQPWSDLLFVREKDLFLLRVDADRAYTLLPFKDMNINVIRKTGLVMFKNVIESSLQIFIGNPITYKDIATVVESKNMIGYLHHQFLRTQKGE